MNARKLIAVGIKARTLWLAFLAGIATGWFLCVAWMLVIFFAPGIAVDLIARAGGLQ